MIAKLITNEKGTSVGHVCPKCGKEHKWDMYVFAHMRIELHHTCDCGQKMCIRNGIVRTLDR